MLALLASNESKTLRVPMVNNYLTLYTKNIKYVNIVKAFQEQNL